MVSPRVRPARITEIERGSRNHGPGKENTSSVLNERTCFAHIGIAVASSVAMPTSQWSTAAKGR